MRYPTSSVAGEVAVNDLGLAAGGPINALV